MVDLKTLSDLQLIEMLKTERGERFETAFGELVRRYKTAILTYLTRYTGDARTAEDLAQEAFVRVYRKIGAYDARARFSTWLYTIAGNLAKDEFKRRRRHPAASYDWRSQSGSDTTHNIPAIADEQESPDRVALKTEIGERVQRMLDRLDAPDREVLILREIQGMKYDEIAELLSLPMGTVKSRIARARVAFRQLWDGEPS